MNRAFLVFTIVSLGVSVASAVPPATSTAPTTQPAANAAGPEKAVIISDEGSGVITNGVGGSVGVGTGEGGKLAKFGTPGGGSGPGPKGPFGNGAMSVKRVVYIVDHSGSMIDNFDFLRDEIKTSMSRLSPLQQFAILTVSEKVDDRFPAKDLQSATPEGKRNLVNFIDNVRAAGKNDGALDQFSDAFTEAFALKPDIIYFVADGSINPKLADKIKELRGEKAVIKISTIAFVNVSKETEELLKTIAADNLGKFKYIMEKDLGK